MPKQMNTVGSRKYYQLFGFAILCVLINYGGKELAEYYSLPLWLDAFGTVLAAYMLGPVWGAVVGVAGNIIHGFSNPVSFIYALTSMSIGLCVGFLAKRHFFDTLFKTASVGVLVSFISTCISMIFNIIFYGGMTSNIWGDGVIGYLSEKNFPPILCYFTGEFYIDFLDKVLTFNLIFMILSINKRFGKSIGKKVNVGILAIAVLFVSFGKGTTVYAVEDTSFVQTIYNSTNGLSCGAANDIVQTNDGILWIGTYSGLYRYNGSDMQWQDEYESIKNVNCLYVDDAGRLWIGTNDNGFSICEDEVLTDVVDDSNGLSSNSVRCIVQSADGNYYIGTTSSMHVVSIDGGVRIIDDIEEVNYAVCVAADAFGNVATIDTNGILYLLNGANVVIAMELGKGQEIFNSCAFDAEGTLYVGTSANHIYTYDISNGKFVKKNVYECGNLIALNDIYFADDGGIFICADNGVGYLDTNKSYVNISTGSFNNSIDNMEIDYQGNLWFASSRLGVLRLSDSKVFDYYESLGVDRKVVNTSTFWNGMLYVGTDNGLDVLDLDNNCAVNNELTQMLNGMRIRCIKSDSKDRLWICTYGSGLWEVTDEGISTYDTNNGKFGDRARAVIEMSDGTIVAAGDNGIIFIDNDEVVNTFTYGAGLSNAMILSLMEMPDGSLMAGSDGDGIAIIKDGSVYKTLTRSDGLSSGVILRTVRDNAGDGTFVVTSNGLCYISSDFTVTTLDNFPYFNNYDITESSDGKLFVLGSAGIYIVDRDELMSGGEVNYELLDSKTGLSTSLTVNSWNECEGGDYLYLSCDNGVYGLNMLDATNDYTYYRMSVASVKLDNVAYNIGLGDVLNIERNVNKIEIFPEIINYTTYDPYISYYLEGFETAPTVAEASEVGSIVYTNVPPGTYTFHLSILDNDKETVLEEITYEFVKAKEIYDNTWFMVYMIFVLALFVSWLTWFIVRTQIQRTINLQKKELELAKSQIEMGNQTILAIANTVDAKDVNTSRHSQRVSEYSVLIAKEMGKSEEECELLRKTALLHDIGKIAIPDRVLNKPGKLTDEEYELMKSHTTKGAEILKDFTLIKNVWEGALYHHERYDGTGYTLGLKGEAIPINARIIGLADAFDAMTANRVYRKKLDFNYVLSELKKGRGTQFDPVLVDILLKLIDEGKINIEEIYAS
jgi:energy-coupling factor transport system substrate-specific component